MNVITQNFHTVTPTFKGFFNFTIFLSFLISNLTHTHKEQADERCTWICPLCRQMNLKWNTHNNYDTETEDKHRVFHDTALYQTTLSNDSSNTMLFPRTTWKQTEATCDQIFIILYLKTLEKLNWLIKKQTHTHPKQIKKHSMETTISKPNIFVVLLLVPPNNWTQVNLLVLHILKNIFINLRDYDLPATHFCGKSHSQVLP